MVQAGKGTSIGNMARATEEEWRTLKDSDPALYQACREAAQEDECRYDRELATWRASGLRRCETETC
jgi:hypothetical protein